MNHSTDGIIGIMEHKIWETKTTMFYQKYAADFLLTYINKIVVATKLSPEKAEALLRVEMAQIGENLGVVEFINSFNKAAQNVIDKNSK